MIGGGKRTNSNREKFKGLPPVHLLFAVTMHFLCQVHLHNLHPVAIIKPEVCLQCLIWITLRHVQLTIEKRVTQE